MLTLNKVGLGLAALVGVLWLSTEARSDPVSVSLQWDYPDPVGITFIGYQDGAEVCRVSELLECPLMIEPGAYSFTVQADNGLWQSDMSTPFLSPPVPSAPSGVSMQVP